MDGCEIRIPRAYEWLYNDICKAWEMYTNLTLEFVDYQKMWIRDINNYGCLSTNGKIKNKGYFEVEKVIGGEPAYHKDNSFKIVKIALQEHFVNNIPVEKTIKNHENIYDFCGREKFKGEDYGETCILDYDNKGNPYMRITKQQKNTRYYITNKGSTFYKRYAKGTSEVINKGFEVEIFNKYIEKDMIDYNVNYNYYINLANKEIENICSKQMNLF